MPRLIYHWPSIQAYFDAGHGFVACQQRFGFSHTAWIRAIQRGKLRIPKPNFPHADRRRKYDWAAVQAYYDAGHLPAVSGTIRIQRGRLDEGGTAGRTPGSRPASADRPGT